jgi:hypothetical protein
VHRHCEEITVPKKKEYKGILAEPMRQWTLLTAPSDDELSALIDEKWKALFAHFDIDSSEAFGFGPGKAAAWANLAWHLAREHVPGFAKPPRKRGKPPIHKDDDVTVALHIELFRRRDKLSDRRAIEKIVAEDVVPGSVEAILGRYKRKKKLFASVSRLFDNVAVSLGPDTVVELIQEALTEEEH